MKYRRTEMLIGALRRPDLALRFLMGKLPSEFDLREVSRYVESTSPIVVEAGAFDGKDTKRFAELWPNGIIYAFEPMPSLAKKARDTTFGLTNVVLIEAALGFDDSDSVELYTFGDNQEPHGSSSILKPEDHLEIAPQIHFQRRLPVKAITLDDWHASVGSPQINLLWLDLQGAEQRVLERGTQTLSRTDVIHVEVSRRPLYEGGATFRQLNTFLVEHGFKLKASRIPVRSGNAIYVRRKK